VIGLYSYITTWPQILRIHLLGRLELRLMPVSYLEILFNEVLKIFLAFVLVFSSIPSKPAVPRYAERCKLAAERLYAEIIYSKSLISQRWKRQIPFI